MAEDYRTRAYPPSVTVPSAGETIALIVSLGGEQWARRIGSYYSELNQGFQIRGAGRENGTYFAKKTPRTERF